MGVREWLVGWMADAKELRNGWGQVNQVRVAYNAAGFAVRRRLFGTYFLPFINRGGGNKKMHDASPGASVGST